MRLRIAVVALLVIASIGCDEAMPFFGHRDAAEGVRSIGVVTFSRGILIDGDPAASAPSERFTIDARFVRYGATLEADTRAILGLSDVDALPEIDSCASLGAGPAEASNPAADPPPGGAGIELLDVGRIRVRTGNRELWLPVRTFPDLLDVMSGVTYGGVADLPFRPSRPYEVRGDRDRTPWVSVAAPPDWSGLHVNGLAVDEGLAGALDEDRALALRWDPWTDRPSEVAVTLTWTDPAGNPEGVVCHPADDGTFNLPQEQVSRLPEAPEFARLTLRVERFSRVSFQMDRVDEAEAIFRVSVTAPLR